MVDNIISSINHAEIQNSPYQNKFGIIYCRVSTQKQVDDGDSLSHQEHICRNWCEKNKIIVVKNNGEYVFKDEGISGGKMELDDEDQKKQAFIKSLDPICKKIPGIHHRPGLIAALKACKKDYIFITYAMTRLSRNATQSLVIAEYLKQKKIHLVCIQDNIDTVGKKEDQSVKIHLQSLFAQMEHTAIKERTKSALQALKEQGRYLGRIRYGYKLENGQKYDDLIEDPDEQKVIALMKELRNTVKNRFGKQISYYYISEYLNNQGYRTRSGKKWCHSQVEYICNAQPPNLKGNPKKRIKQGTIKQSDINEDENLDSPKIHQQVEQLVKAEIGKPQLVNISTQEIEKPVEKNEILSRLETKTLEKKKEKKKKDDASDSSDSDSDSKEYEEFLKYKKMKKKLEKKKQKKMKKQKKRYDSNSDSSDRDSNTSND
jgi:DNA invertase Pin-like site-specific DNA recombinase